MEFIPPSPWAILLAAASMFMVGGLWYGPLFGGAWQRAAGLDDAALGQGVARVFGLAFVLALVQTANLGFFIGGNSAPGFAVFAALATGIGFTAPAIATAALFARRPATLILIDGGYQVVAYGVAGAIFALFAGG